MKKIIYLVSILFICSNVQARIIELGEEQITTADSVAQINDNFRSLENNKIDKNSNAKVSTIDTGDGAFEIGQDLRTTDAVSFSSVTVTNLNSLIKYKVGTFTSSASTGNQPVSGVGFKPRLVFFSPLITASASAYSGNGCMDSAGNQWAYATNVTISTSHSSTIKYTTFCILINIAGSAAAFANYVSMDDDGFTVNWQGAAANTIGYIAIQ